MTALPGGVPRIALVTGAAQGLGAAIAAGLHDAGHRVMLADIDSEAAGRTAAAIGRERAASFAMDVRHRESVLTCVRACEQRFGPVDILVNNAALTRASDFFDLDPHEWDEVLAVNLRSVMLTCQAIARGMMERGFGRIINMSSIAGQRGGPQIQGIHYATSKAGIIAMTRYLAHLFAGHGVTVNAVAPGPIASEQTALAPQEKLAEVLAHIPASRLGRPEEVASLVRYLASDEAGFITGATHDINGGLSMR